MHSLRTHTCGELRREHTGLTVRLSGWLHRKRDHANVLFLDLRDHYGVVQCVLDGASPLLKTAEALRLESVITVTGQVVARAPDAINPRLATGEVEVAVGELAIQSTADPLPLQVNSDTELPEETRLRYRFLDLRRERLHRNIVLRSRVIASIRRRMIEAGFTEFQTPILTSSSPEGARDYLVPSRVHPGMFYALPQAPQQFKQLLMVAGFDRYFQIAPCFRDEDGRADRSPGEFYQLDFEMSFVTQEEVFAAFGPVLHGVFEEFRPECVVTPPPFPRIPFDEAMLTYGSDKPDLRNPLAIRDVTAAFRDSGFAVFAAAIAGGVRNKLGEELGLIEKHAFRFCWVTDFPMYELNEETGKIEFSHNPFSMPQGGLEALESKDPLTIKAYQYDIVCNGVELSSGAIRNHRADIMYKVFAIAGYSRAEVEARFGGMLNAFKFGAPPHGGSAPGIDRIVMLIAGETNIREVIAFPMNQQAQDLLMQAPAPVPPERLKELHIKLDLPPE